LTGRIVPLLLALPLSLRWGACTGTSVPHDPPANVADAALLGDVERRSFQYFWDLADPRTLLVPDRAPTPSFSSIAAVGFGLTAYGIGAERGYVTREQAAGRTLATLRSLLAMKQGPEPRGVSGYKGFFYHFLDMRTAERFQTVELSTVDTSLLMAGVLFAQSYFDRGDPTGPPSAPRPSSSTSAWTGPGSRRGRRRSAWAGRPRKVSIPMIGKGTTRR